MLYLVGGWWSDFEGGYYYLRVSGLLCGPVIPFLLLEFSCRLVLV